jgi:pimeloyl-ACP methyl ester carboxylesterase
MPGFTMRWHTFALDFRGHGGSDHVPNGYHWEAYAQDIISFLKEKVKEPVFLLGHSLGAMVAIEIAAKAPELVRAVMLEDPPLYRHRGERLKASPNYRFFVAWRDLGRTAYSLESWLAALAALNPEDHDVGYHSRAASLRLLDPDVLAQVIDGSATENYDVEAYLQKITCPALLLRGNPAFGGAIDDQDLERFKTLLSTCLIVQMQDVGHGIHSQKPVEFFGVVSTFLEAL